MQYFLTLIDLFLLNVLIKKLPIPFQALQNPRILKCRLDSKFLLKALRFRKHSIPKAQEMIERYLIYREGLYGYDFFSNLDPLRPNLFTLLESGVIIPLPKRDKFKRRIILMKMSNLDVSLPNVGCTFLALLTLVMEVLVEEEENQIRGVSYIFDFSGMTAKHAMIFPLDVWYKFGKNSEKACAMRHKAFNIVNLPKTLIFFINFAVKQMHEKLQKRVKFFSCSVAETGLVEMENLPIEFGGKIQLKKITDEWKEIFISHREHFLKVNSMAINREMYSEDVLQCTPGSLKKSLY